MHQVISFSDLFSSKSLVDYSNHRLCPFNLQAFLYREIEEQVIPFDLYETYTTTLNEVDFLFDKYKLVGARQINAPLRNSLLQKIHNFIQMNEKAYPKTIIEKYRLMHDYFIAILSNIKQLAVDLLIGPMKQDNERNDKLIELKDSFYKYLIKLHFVNSQLFDDYVINYKEDKEVDINISLYSDNEESSLFVDDSIEELSNKEETDSSSVFAVRLIDFNMDQPILREDLEKYTKMNGLRYEYLPADIKTIADILNPVKKLIIYSYMRRTHRAQEILEINYIHKKLCIGKTLKITKEVVNYDFTCDRRLFIGYFINQKEKVFSDNFYKIFIPMFEKEIKPILDKYNEKL